MALASLCAGAGGLDLGFCTESDAIAFACDLDETSCKTYEANLGHSIFCRDVFEVDARELSSIDVVLAGPPCQGFSSLGRQDASDDRNAVILRVADLIAEARPPFFLIENVRGLLWMERGGFKRQLIRSLGRKGVASVIEIDCARWGIPQRRRRVLFVGGFHPRAKLFVQAVEDLARKQFPALAVESVLKPTPELGSLPNHEARAVEATWYFKVAPHIAPGQKLCDTRRGDSAVHSWDLPEAFGETTVEERSVLLTVSRLRRSEINRRWEKIGDGRPVLISNVAEATSISSERCKYLAEQLVSKGFLVYGGGGDVDLARRFNGRFRRLPLNAPAPAVVKEFGFMRNVLHPLEDRGLTVRECARLQTFPDWFTFHGSLGSQYQQVANAFPVKAAGHVRQALENVLRGGPRC